MTNAKRYEGELVDRLTHLCSVMTSALEGDPEYKDGDKAILMLKDDSGQGGIVLSGYDDDMRATADLIIHLQAIFEANGKVFKILPLGRG